MREPVRRLDAVILAGTHNQPRHLLRKKNKAFLEVGGLPMLLRVLRAVRAAASIDRIAVVGPIDQLRSFKKRYDQDFIEVDQEENLVENAWSGFLGTLDPQELVLTPPSERPGIGPLQPGRPRPDFHELYGQVAHEMALRGSRELPMYHWERIVREYRDYLGRVGHSYPPDFEVSATDRMRADREVIHLVRGHLSFQSAELQQQYARFHSIMDRPVFYLTADVPLITPESIDDFVARCQPLDRDYYIGLSTESTLRPYHLGCGGEGIVRPFVNLYEYRARLANMNLVKPNRIGRIQLILRGFELRKMKQWSSVLRLIGLVMALPGRTHMIKIVSYAQAAAVLARKGWVRPSMFFRRRLRLDDLSATISRALLADCTFITTPFGGVSLDVDTEHDLATLKANLNTWLGYQDEIARRMGYGPRQLPPVEQESMEAPGQAEEADPSSDSFGESRSIE